MSEHLAVSDTSNREDQWNDDGLSVNLAPDLRAMVERLAKQANLTTDEVIVRALLNQQLIAEQKMQGRSFQIKDPKAGVAGVDFV